MLTTTVISFLLVSFPFGIHQSKAEDAVVEKGYNPAMDFWRQLSSTMDYKQYKGLRELIAQNEDVSKEELEKKIGEWAKENGLEQDFKIFTDIQREYRKAADSHPKSDEITHVNGNENVMTKIIGELAVINEDQSISFKEACRRQNKLVRSVPSADADTFGLKNLLNPWCES